MKWQVSLLELLRYERAEFCAMFIYGFAFTHFKAVGLDERIAKRQIGVEHCLDQKYRRFRNY